MPNKSCGQMVLFCSAPSFGIHPFVAVERVNNSTADFSEGRDEGRDVQKFAPSRIRRRCPLKVIGRSIWYTFHFSLEERGDGRSQILLIIYQ